MQAVAADMNLSETAFLLREGSGFRLRWFTPKVEVDLCGHATLAAAHVLWREIGLPANEPLTFATRSGLLTAARRETLIELDFPLEPASDATPPPGLLDALRGVSHVCRRNRFDYLIEVASEDVVKSLEPDFPALGKTRGARRHRDQPCVVARSRFRLALLRTRGGRQRRPGHRDRPTAASAPTGNNGSTRTRSWRTRYPHAAASCMCA